MTDDPALLAALHGDHDTAERILRTERPQDDPRVMFNLGWHEIRRGNLSAGLRLNDAGRYINCYGLPPLPGKIWRDEDLTGKTLLFRQEGGYGDQILNFRFARDFVARGARVVMSCAPGLQPLFNRHGFVTCDNGHVHGLHYDYWMPAMSAPHVLGYEHDTLDGSPYLTALPRDPLFAKPSTLRVGIRWAGNPEFEHQQHRLFPPEPLIGLHGVPGVTLYSLQRDDNLIDGLPFADLRHLLTDWEETASIISGLDLVLHLGGSPRRRAGCRDVDHRADPALHAVGAAGCDHALVSLGAVVSSDHLRQLGCSACHRSRRAHGARQPEDRRMNWCHVVDDRIVYGPSGLPKSYDGVSGFNLLPEAELRARGWRPHRFVENWYDGCIIVGSTTEILPDEVVETQHVRAATPEDLPVPDEVSPRQLRLALLDMGLLDQVEALVVQADRAVQIMWEYSITYERSHPAWEQMGAMLTPPATAQDIDVVFRLAATK